MSLMGAKPKPYRARRGTGSLVAQQTFDVRKSELTEEMISLGRIYATTSFLAARQDETK